MKGLILNCNDKKRLARKDWEIVLLFFSPFFTTDKEVKMPIRESKSFQKFRSRVDYINQHLQIIDVSLRKTSQLLNKSKMKSETIVEFLNLDKNLYNMLNHPISNKANLFRYSRSRNNQYAMIELYKAFTCYLKDLLAEFFENDPIKIAGKAQNSHLSFFQIVELGSYEKISDQIISSVFRKLENERSTSKLLEKILNHTKISIDDQKKFDGLMYLEIRHLIIHNNCKADDNFKNKYRNHVAIDSKGKISMTFDLVYKAIISITDLAKDIDEKLLSDNIIKIR
ncbi:hypothetical protein K9M79_05035 [Candidatus Woesearchaeota archaeon]|nr:hypothetical protein [Candidatus Woesearchaeota archaeon]